YIETCRKLVPDTFLSKYTFKNAIFSNPSDRKQVLATIMKFDLELKKYIKDLVVEYLRKQFGHVESDFEKEESEEEESDSLGPMETLEEIEHEFNKLMEKRKLRK